MQNVLAAAILEVTIVYDSYLVRQVNLKIAIARDVSVGNHIKGILDRVITDSCTLRCHSERCNITHGEVACVKGPSSFVLVIPR